MTTTTTPTSTQIVDRRHDFMLLFDVQDGNPNGDPDAGNMPRFDPETGHGLVSDVCIKRKVRDVIFTAKGDQPPYRIYVQHQSRGGKALNELHNEAHEALNTPSAERRNPGVEVVDRARRWMCEHFYDVRTFGAVMSTGVNCGQARGAVQITFGRSIDPIVPTEYSITRVAKTTAERAAEKAGTTEMGRKYAVPYALYRAYGFVSPSFAEQTGFTYGDLDLLWDALCKMFWDDHSAARGEMETRGLFVFRHGSRLGEAPAHMLFDLIRIERRDPERPPRSFDDYRVTVDRARLPKGVELLQPCGFAAITG